MANRRKICKGKKSDSSCTCNSSPECQDDNNDSKQDRNINDTAYNTQNNECSSDCINCKLLNRLYILLEEIVENRKKSKHTEETQNSRCDNDKRTSIKNNNQEDPKIKENWTRLANKDMDSKECKIFNVYNNNTGSNKVSLCDCDKSAACRCTHKNENTSTVPKANENTTRSSAQHWHSIGEINKRNQVDFACQCTCLKKDSSTQDNYPTKEETMNEKASKKCNCTDSAVNTDTQNNACLQNLFCSLSNDPMFSEVMKLMHCPNVVVLSNGCSCCNKCNCPLERTSVTTNTSDIIVTAQEKKNEMVNLQDLDMTEMYQELPQEGTVTFPKNIRTSRDKSIFNSEFTKNRALSNISRSSKDIPRQSLNNNDFLKDTTYMVPEETDYTVASVLVPKKEKKKATPKSKKRKSKGSADSKESTNERRDSANTYCQTDKKLTDEKCQNVLPNTKTSKDAAICCDMNTCHALSPKLVEKESSKNTAIKNQKINSCNCTEIKNFVSIITELCAQMNKSKEKANEIVACECNDKKNTVTKTPVVPEVTPVPDDCAEIHRLAEKIAEIHLKSNQNRSIPSNEFRRSVDLVKSTNSDCDLTNCMNINPIPVASDNADECYCRICPCKKNSKYDRKDDYPVRKEKRGRSSINSTPKRATKKFNDCECTNTNLNKWTQQYPSISPQKCACSNYECMEETEIGCLNYNISEHSKEVDNCQVETCPQLRRIIKDCLCDSKNCYCHNSKLNELKTTAKLERLADEVISTITPCNCLGQQCTCTKNNNTMDPGFRRYTARQVCFSSIYHENQRKITNNTGKEKNLFDKDVNGNPCLIGSTSETKSYIKKLLNNKPTNQNKACLKKVIQSSNKKLKSLSTKPLLPILDLPCTQINCINSLFPEIYEALSKIKQLTNWESLPQEIVEIVIDKILKREIKSALQQLTDGVVKINLKDDGYKKNDTNILNILMEDKIQSNEKEFKNNILEKCPEHTKQTSPHRCSKEKLQDTMNLTKDSYNNIQGNLDLDIDQDNIDAKKKPILVQINIEKERNPRKYNRSSISLSPENNKISAENSSIYITENKLGSIKNLISLENNNAHQNWEDYESDASSILSVKEAKQPISININIQMEKQKKIELKDSFMNTDAVELKASSISSLSKSMSENTQTNSSNEMEKSSDLEEIKTIVNDLKENSKDDLQEINKLTNDLQEKKKLMHYLQEKKKPNFDFQQTNYYLCREHNSELPLLEDFLAMNKKMKVLKVKSTPKNINKMK